MAGAFARPPHSPRLTQCLSTFSRRASGREAVCPRNCKAAAFWRQQHEVQRPSAVSTSAALLLMVATLTANTPGAEAAELG